MAAQMRLGHFHDAHPRVQACELIFNVVDTLGKRFHTQGGVDPKFSDMAIRRRQRRTKRGNIGF
jgi:hypothetical protein